MKLDELENEFNRLISTAIPLSAEQQILLEKEKLTFYKDITTLMAQSSKPLKKDVTKPVRWLYLRTFIYYVLLTFGFLERAVGSFLFARSLLVLIPLFSPPVVIAGSIIITIINSILFYAFEASMFKTALGIPATLAEQQSLINLYTEQLTLLEKINNKLFTIDFVINTNHEHYQKLARITLLMNQDFKAKQKAFGKYHESLTKKIIRYLIIGFGALMTGAGTYFMATSLLTLISAPLLGTPIGWILISLMIIAGLGFYLSVQGRSMIELINPDYKSFKTFKTNLTNFESKDEHNIYLVEQLHKKLSSSNNPTDKESITSINFNEKQSIATTPTFLLTDNLIEIENKLAFCQSAPTFFNHLFILRENAKTLASDGHEEAANVAETLYWTLLVYYHNYYISDKTSSDKKNFITLCMQAINEEARPTLEIHRGLKQLLGNLGIAIAGVGIFYPLVGLVNLAINGRFLFFQTNSAIQLNALEESVLTL